MNTCNDGPEQIMNGLCLPGTDVGVVDLIALVLGINFNSVRKLLMALDALAKAGIALEDLINYAAMPGEPATQERFDKTCAMAQRLSGLPPLRRAERQLHFVELGYGATPRRPT
jgi:hypothetical protein